MANRNLKADAAATDRDEGLGKVFFGSKQMAALLGITPVTLRKLHTEQSLFPAAGKGRWSLDDVVPAYCEYLRQKLAQKHGGQAGTDATERLQAARAESAEIDLAVKRQQYMPVDIAAATVANLFVTVRQKVLAIPDMVSALIVDATTPRKARSILHEAFSEALTQAADAADEWVGPAVEEALRTSTKRRAQRDRATSA